ncbi:hypothetical protein MUP77_12430 [Candidatus Bathyarchaeota archaeon]|nr:hypothetical protein [Candidatus Bathyarchaeota archaeon]
MSEYNDPWLMHALLIEHKRDHQFAMLDDAIWDEIRDKHKGADGLSLEQRLVISKFLIGKRQIDDSADFIKEWTSEICEGVIARDAVIARLQTETTNELADKLGTTYSATYHTIMGKLKRFEGREGLKGLFEEYHKRIKYAEGWRESKKAWVKDGIWDDEEEKKTILEPITEDDWYLLYFGANRQRISSVKAMYEEYREGGRLDRLGVPVTRDKELDEKWRKTIEESDRLVADFRRWLNEEDRRLFE